MVFGGFPFNSLRKCSKIGEKELFFAVFGQFRAVLRLFWANITEKRLIAHKSGFLVINPEYMGLKSKISLKKKLKRGKNRANNRNIFNLRGRTAADLSFWGLGIYVSLEK